MLDPMTSLAFSIYSGKGVHALLLGSGISFTSGITTGWDVVVDLIRKAARLEEKDCGDDPAAWYQTNYGEEPDYSKLLEMVAPSQAERQQLLRGYFEPTQEERAEGKKVPTAAHRAIAQLVAEGYIRVIVTTNFDQLMENALRELGVVPTVISSPDSIKGAKPLTQSGCTIIKVHGDYLDTRIKNTPEEVQKYTRDMNQLLKRVFDEYGLIVCGWSADWDVALRAAVESSKSRRYTMYWSAYGEPSEHAKKLCEFRDARVIKGMGADQFFTALSDKVAVLREMDAPHPLTKGMAIAALKKYLVEDKYRIKLEELVLGEADKVATTLFINPGMQRQRITLKQYETHLNLLLPLLATGGYWGKAAHRRLWLGCFQKLVTPRSSFSPCLHEHLDYYPAYLSLYVFGIAALAGNRSGNLAFVLAKGKAKDEQGGEFPLIHRMFTMLRDTALDNAIEQEDPTAPKYKLPTSRYLLIQSRKALIDLIPEESRHDELFCRFEYMVGLVISDIYQKSSNCLFGSYSGMFLNQRSLPDFVQREIDTFKERWPFLRAGLFDGSLDRLRETKIGFDEASNRVKMQLRIY